MEIKLETQTIRTIAAFENITKVQPKDCIITENSVYFLVDPKKVGLAIGRNGSIVREVRRILGKNVKIFGYANNPKSLIENMVPNLKSFEMSDGVITISIPMDDRTTVIGKNGENIKAMREILKRHFAIKNLRLRK
jgi:N utilization substance protein A